jgi:DNA-binding response OmpR family regulator
MRTLNRILLAEDEPDIRAICTMALESIGGFEVKSCDNGRAVLECFDSFRPDLVVLDVMMPELDGPSTLAQMQTRTTGAHTPVVFLTARSRTEDVERLRRLGALDVLPKPFDPVALPGSIQEIWNRYVVS